MKCALLTQNCVLIMAAALYTEPGHCVCVLYTSLARVFSGTTHLMLMCLGLCLATITSCEDLVRLIRLIIDCVIGIMYNWIAGLCQLSVCVCLVICHHSFGRVITDWASSRSTQPRLIWERSGERGDGPRRPRRPWSSPDLSVCLVRHFI